MAQEIIKNSQSEHISAPEHSGEKIETPASGVEPHTSESSQQPIPPIPALPQTQPSPKPEVDKMQKEIETVLTENIAEMYKQLPQDKKSLFKQKGEEIANQISGMIRGGLLEIKKILKMIREWLLIIPGVNKFFLEQEAKIKTSKIQVIYEREHAPAL